MIKSSIQFKVVKLEGKDFLPDGKLKPGVFKMLAKADHIEFCGQRVYPKKAENGHTVAFNTSEL